MATTLSNIRFLIERNLKKEVENEDVVNWCNYVNTDVGMSINIPADPAESITLTTIDMQYALPADLKIINRLRLQSVIDQGLDAELGISYRVYNGNIILPRICWIAPDTLVVDYYKHMTYFATMDDVIDIEDRFTPLYSSYGLSAARGNDPLSDPAYLNVKRQVVANYGLRNEPTVINGRW